MPLDKLTKSKITRAKIPALSSAEVAALKKGEAPPEVRNAMISACRHVGILMTRAKLIVPRRAAPPTP